MRLTIEPTEHFFMVGDVMVRMWQGTTAQGEEVVALITAVAGAREVSELSASLVSIPPPTPAEAERWARKVLEDKMPPDAKSHA